LAPEEPDVSRNRLNFGLELRRSEMFLKQVKEDIISLKGFEKSGI
jgi:hypothetical protein